MTLWAIAAGLDVIPCPDDILSVEPSVRWLLGHPRRLSERVVQASPAIAEPGRPQRARPHRIHRNARLGHHQSIIVKAGISGQDLLDRDRADAEILQRQFLPLDHIVSFHQLYLIAGQRWVGQERH